MSECICNSCKNLKGVMDDSGAVEEYECRFGFPSEICPECDGGGCNLTCEHFIIDEDEDILVGVKCSSCGRELLQAGNDNTDGKIFCIDCYLKHNS